MPWIAIDYDDPMRDEIVEKHNVNILPELLLMNSDKYIGKSCKDDLEAYGEKAYEIWLNS